MTTDEILDIFRQCGALLEGHFILSSGLRSPVFLQKARVFMHPDKAETLCRALAEKLRAEGYGGLSQIVSPAVGGISLAMRFSPGATRTGCTQKEKPKLSFWNAAPVAKSRVAMPGFSCHAVSRPSPATPATFRGVLVAPS